ncbi:anti-sigma factor [Glacieibacterium sp.]|uniref:anti-sigma factor n=1 Tax=Glacieibacterium sp. TaxID=2860237 RepID=UPI003B001E46
MTIDEAELIAWLDGELAPADAARVAGAVAVDPALAKLADAHRRVAERLRKGFAPLATEPVPAALVAAANAGAPGNVVDFRRPEAAPSAARRFVLPNWTALAATLLVGVMAGALVVSGGEDLAGRSGEVTAGGALANALDTQLASAPRGEAIRVALTFRAHDGRLCRTWSNPTQTGVACRAGDSWAIKALLTAPPQQQGAYRTASGASPQLMAIVDAMIDGPALGAAEEAAARDKSWR